MKRFASASLALELVGTVLFAFVISHGVMLMLFASQRARDARFVRLDVAEERLAALASLLPGVSPALQEQYLFAASGRGERLELTANPAVGANEPRSRELEQRFRAALQPLHPLEVRVTIREHEGRRLPRNERPHGFGGPGGGPPRNPPPPMILRRFAIAAELPDGRWLNAQFVLPRPHPAAQAILLSAGVSTVALILASLYLALRFAGPLRRLADASARLRPGEPASEVPVRGPTALKDVIRSFNARSKRLLGTLEGQRAMLAAIAHDLRTPITSLKLRLELLDDGETKERMQASLDELQNVTEAAVDALKAEGVGEAVRAVDLSALVESVCSDLADLGESVTYLPGRAVTCRCRPHEIKRAVRNLVENAVRYGGAARVRTEIKTSEVRVFVDDDGPGIPQADLDRVFEPFQRLEGSRSRETGGHGLGLTIARSIARGHGGDITLANRPGGGLTACLRIPA
ncbi:MAG: HAMP domain-containing sensor histidine kinase [Alphaproteobacteria bacterium]